MTRALARRALRVIAVEPDPAWAKRLRDHGVRVIERDFLAVTLPREPFRIFGSLPFARTTDILHRLLDDPALPMRRADVIVQWEVAVKRAAVPPVTLVSTAWAPWWEMHLARRIPAAMFRPVPRVDAGLLVITRRIRRFYRSQWRVAMPTSFNANGRSTRLASARAWSPCRRRSWTGPDRA